jgi:hypothetical protein
MPKVKYITSPNEIPAGQKYMLVMYGEEYGQTRHPLGLTITVACQRRGIAVVPPSTAGTDGRRTQEMSVPLQRPDTPISKHTSERAAGG